MKEIKDYYDLAQKELSIIWQPGTEMTTLEVCNFAHMLFMKDWLEEYQSSVPDFQFNQNGHLYVVEGRNF